MTTVQAAERVTPPTPELRPYRFTVRQYQGMIDARVLTEEDRCELLEGVVVPKMTHNPPHDAAIMLLTRRLFRLLPDEWLVRVQSAIQTRRSRPEPDVAVVRGPEDLYFRQHPNPKEVALLVEVAEATLAQDRGPKARIYGRAGVPTYWVVNLIDGQIEVYTEPRAGRRPGFRRRDDYRPGQKIPLVLAGEEIAKLQVRELLP
jgi:Uma2 family endonuclease